MSLNQLTPEGKTGAGVNVSVHTLTSYSHEPELVAGVYTITKEQLQKQQMLLSNEVFEAVSISFPTDAELNEILLGEGDYLEMTIKYKTSGIVNCGTADGNVFFIGGGFTQLLESSNGSSWKSVKVGVGKPSVSSGSLRMF